VIANGPLIKLEAVQALLNSGDFDTERLWLATDECERDLRKERWSIADVLHMLVGMDGAQDYYKSEWCEVLGGRWVPCDVYRPPMTPNAYAGTPKACRSTSSFRSSWMEHRPLRWFLATQPDRINCKVT